MGTRKKPERRSLEWKQDVVKRMKTSSNFCELARELKVGVKQLYVWRLKIEGPPEAKYPGPAEGCEPSTEFRLIQENGKLKSALAEKVMELDFFKSALRRVKEASRTSNESGDPAFTPRSGQERGSKAD